MGAGLIGTSIGMVLAAHGNEVSFSDSSPRSAELAHEIVSGFTPGINEKFDLLIAAVPTSKVPEVIINAFQQDLALNYMDVASVKTNCVAQIEAYSAELASAFCGSHPIAGREVSGPESAQADLFDGRPWIVTPTNATSESAREVISSVLKSVGAVEIVMSPQEHDAAMALISHSPQVLSSLMAGELMLHSPQVAALAGQGLRDVTRIAASESQLWVGILSANSAALRPVLSSIYQRLGDLITAIEGDLDHESITRFLEAGRAGRELIPGKHGGKRRYVVLPVLIADSPGQLKRLFNDAGDAQINIEDVSMEHSPGHPTGLVQLSVAPESASRLEEFLRERGWRIYPPRNPDNLI
ncbi:MAG TPA: prephenate dehydrogenase [Candidatus Nanopelagicaceae bacterium]|nr:prephenate dehydrogenase [Candidatus Nanopelagicaceae bacterium]